jgi:hypothetical protein
LEKKHILSLPEATITAGVLTNFKFACHTIESSVRETQQNSYLIYIYLVLGHNTVVAFPLKTAGGLQQFSHKFQMKSPASLSKRLVFSSLAMIQAILLQMRRAQQFVVQAYSCHLRVWPASKNFHINRYHLVPFIHQYNESIILNIQQSKSNNNN